MGKEIKKITEEDISNITGLLNRNVMKENNLISDSDYEKIFMVDLYTNNVGCIGIAFEKNGMLSLRYSINDNIGIDCDKWTEEEKTQLLNVFFGESDAPNPFRQTALGKKPVDLEQLKKVASSFFHARAMYYGIFACVGQDSSAAINLLRRDAKEFLEICNEIESGETTKIEPEIEQ